MHYLELHTMGYHPISFTLQGHWIPRSKLWATYYRWDRSYWPFPWQNVKSQKEV